MKHTCHVHGCNVPVPPRMLFCKPHWFSVSKKTRDRVWNAYNSLSHDANGRLTETSNEYFEATKQAELEALNKWEAELKK